MIDEQLLFCHMYYYGQLYIFDEPNVHVLKVVYKYSLICTRLRWREKVEKENKNNT